MRSRLPAEAADRLLAALPGAATALAEAAWLAVVSSAVSLALHDPAGLGLWSFALAAGAGLLIVRHSPSRWVPPLVVGAAVLGGAVGWLADERARALLGQGSLEAALASHPAGWLAGIALWRGARHRDPASDDLVVGSLLRWGIIGLGVPWLVGWNLGAGRAVFAAQALPATLAFVAAGLVAVGVTRLDALGRASGLDWRRNRAWLALLVGAVALVVAIGLPVTLLVGASGEVLVRILLEPFASAGEAASRFVGPLADRIASGLAGPAGPASEPTVPPAPGSGLALPSMPSWIGVILAIALPVLVVGAAVFVRRRLGRIRPAVTPPARPAGPGRFEERRFVRPALALRLPRPSLPRLGWPRARPITASEAYLRLVAELDTPGLVRAPTETPAAHARRLRASGGGGLALDLLAADFELEQYGRVRLTAAEVRRAISRSLRLRRLLRSGYRSRPDQSPRFRRPSRGQAPPAGDERWPWSKVRRA
ncbi:MAG: DUF4129 domain-containing protein [Chloroflexota bacterium]